MSAKRAAADFPLPRSRSIVQSARSAAQGMHECLAETFQAILSHNECKPSVPPRASAMDTTWWFIPSRKRQNILQDAARLKEPQKKSRGYCLVPEPAVARRSEPNKRQHFCLAKKTNCKRTAINCRGRPRNLCHDANLRGQLQMF